MSSVQLVCLVAVCVYAAVFVVGFVGGIIVVAIDAKRLHSWRELAKGRVFLFLITLLCLLWPVLLLVVGFLVPTRFLWRTVRRTSKWIWKVLTHLNRIGQTAREEP